MKSKKGKSFINLEQLAGGAFAEKLNEALLEVADNIQNPNTAAVAKRAITVTIGFQPNKSRQIANTSIAVKTKLAATETIDTQMVMGLNVRTGELEIAEYDGQIRGQMNLSDYPEADEGTEGEVETTGKPLDLRNRKRRQAEPELVPGRDYDPDTGEVYETAGQHADDQTATGRSVVAIFNKAAQA